MCSNGEITQNDLSYLTRITDNEKLASMMLSATKNMEENKQKYDQLNSEKNNGDKDGI